MSEDETNVSALWKQITRIPRPGRLVDFPRLDPATGETVSQVMMHVLTQEELQDSAAAAEKYTKNKLKDVAMRKDDKSDGYDKIFNNEVSVQILCKAVRDPDSGRPLMPSPRAASQSLTQDEFGMLMRAYFLVQAELGPVVATMSAEEMEGWVTRLVEGAAAHPLALLSSDALTELIMLMAYRLYPSLTVTSSPGSPPDDGSSSPENGSE